ncbi:MULTISPECIES: TetR/AcrR family transcriptional regulator [Gordonia]|uniref:TetR/AcrR family transcriptional regulator n=1 Tax=Gordonia TaxID=2053 RepID=UPI0007E33F4C|nr:MULTISPECIES: TetR/AcrR family transcriptional regulator [unclassified Gordonia (in: high G+C Gram-positive bacteria)]MCG7633373.1 TetR/AcrR family transcriptional regulator [Gordonia sp. McavH-238-E]
MPVATEVREDGPRSKRARILTVAIEQFGRVGYEHTKWASVAGEVGIGQTALYHYFESKAHCLLTIMRLELTDSVERFRVGTAGIPDPAQALRSAIDASLRGEPIDALQRRILQNHMDILSTPRQSDKEEAERLRSRELVAEIEKNWADLIKRGMDEGSFVQGDPVVYSRLVLGALVSVWRWYRPGGPLSLDDLIRTVSDSAIRMVTAP